MFYLELTDVHFLVCPKWQLPITINYSMLVFCHDNYFSHNYTVYWRTVWTRRHLRSFLILCSLVSICEFELTTTNYGRLATRKLYSVTEHDIHMKHQIYSVRRRKLEMGSIRHRGLFGLVKIRQNNKSPAARPLRSENSALAVRPTRRHRSDQACKLNLQKNRVLTTVAQTKRHQSTTAMYCTRRSRPPNKI